MKKLTNSLLILCALFFCIPTMQAQLLWKIEATNNTKEAYLFGTHHLMPIKFLDNIKGLDEALAQAEQIIAEVDIKETKDIANMTYLMRAMLLENNTSLQSLISTETYDKIVQLVSESNSVQYPIEILNKMKPSVISTLLITTFYTQHFLKGNMDTENGMDFYFQTQAEEQGKPTMGLESIQQQAKLLYNSKDIKEEAKDLETFINCIDDPNKLMESLTLLNELYSEQDLEGLYKMGKSNDTGCPGTEMDEETWKLIVDDRNKDWVDNLPELLKDKISFIAVGSLHLPGDMGVINLLKKKGYKLIPISK